MLRGLLRWCEEGSGKGIWVMCRVGVSLRGMGSGSPLEGLPQGDFLKSRYTLNFPDETHPRTYPLSDLLVPRTRIRGDDGRFGGTGRYSLQAVQ